MNKQIKVQQCQTRDGRKVVILADNVPGTNYPAVGCIIEEDGTTFHNQWTKYGSFYSEPDGNQESELDLFPVPVVTVEYAVVWDVGTHVESQGFGSDCALCSAGHQREDNLT